MSAHTESSTYLEADDMLLAGRFAPTPILVRQMSTPTVIRMAMSLLLHIGTYGLQLVRCAVAFVGLILRKELMSILAV
jgi:hypothetical protein